MTKKRLYKRKEYGNSNKKDISYYAVIIANISQIILVGLAIFGYFYTVVPAYQNQTLNEENARLNIENKKMIAEMQSVKNSMQMEIEGKTADLVALNNALTKRTNELETLNRNLIEAQSITEKQIAAANNQLSMISDQMIFSILRSELASNSESRISYYFYSDEYRTTMPRMFKVLDDLTTDNLDTTIKQIFENSSNYVEAALGVLKENYLAKNEEGKASYINAIDILLGRIEKKRDKYNISESSSIQVELYLRSYLAKKSETLKGKDPTIGMLDMVLIKNEAVRDLMKIIKNYPDTNEIIMDIFSE